MNPQDYENLAPLYALGALDGEDLVCFKEELTRSESLQALVREYRDAATALSRGLPPVTPPVELKKRILSAVTGQAKPYPALLSRLFWAAAVVVLFAIVVGSLIHSSDWTVQEIPGKGRLEVRDHAVRFRVEGLPALPADKVYQLWQIGPESKPIPATTFRLDPLGWLIGGDSLKYAVVKGQTLALTMEPVGGSTSPTMPIHLAVVVR